MVVRPPRRDGDAIATVASSAKAQRELGWLPNKPGLRDIISDAWEFELGQQLTAQAVQSGFVRVFALGRRRLDDGRCRLLVVRAPARLTHQAEEEGPRQIVACVRGYDS